MKNVQRSTRSQSENSPPRELRLAAEHLERLVQHVQSSTPYEVCGFLAGVEGEVRGVYPVPNIAPDPITQFVMEPRAQWNAMRALSERGWQILAIYHSHPPGGQAEPSKSDVATAYYPEALTLLIVADISGQITDLRAFAIDAGHACEVSIAVTSQKSC